MFNILIKFVVFILSTIISIILSPFIVVLSAFIPSFTQYFTYIISFFNYAFTYFNFFINLFMIPSALVVAALSFSLSIFVFNLACRTVFFFINAYKTLKP